MTNSSFATKKEEDDFKKQAWYSVHPTLYETGIGIGGFKKPNDIELNVEVGDFAEVIDDDLNEKLIVKIIRYAGERPWWKGYLYLEGHGPCWIVQSVKKPLQTYYFDSIISMEKLPMPDYKLKRVKLSKVIKLLKH